MKAKFTTFHVLPMTPQLKRLQNTVYREVLRFAKMERPDLENLADTPELEQLCDCLTLVRSGAIQLDYTDCLPGSENEGIVLKLNMT